MTEPGNDNVRAADAVARLTVYKEEFGEIGPRANVQVLDEVLADHPAGIGDVRHQQQARAFERPASHYYRAARLDLAVFSGRLVNEADPRGQPLRVDVDLVGHRVGDQREGFGIFLHQRNDLSEGRIIERGRLATVLAAAAIMTLAVSVVSFGQHSAAHANGAQPGLFGRFL